MMNPLYGYVLTFILTMWGPRQSDVHRLREMAAITADIVSTDASPEEALRLGNIAAMESGFERKAKGPHGERSAFQIMPPARSYDAKEALRRMRVQGIQSYCGCVRPCPRTVAHRTEKAMLWRFAFDPPEVSIDVVRLASAL